MKGEERKEKRREEKGNTVVRDADIHGKYEEREKNNRSNLKFHVIMNKRQHALGLYTCLIALVPLGVILTDSAGNEWLFFFKS